MVFGVLIQSKQKRDGKKRQTRTHTHVIYAYTWWIRKIRTISMRSFPFQHNINNCDKADTMYTTNFSKSPIVNFTWAPHVVRVLSRINIFLFGCRHWSLLFYYYYFRFCWFKWMMVLNIKNKNPTKKEKEKTTFWVNWKYGLFPIESQLCHSIWMNFFSIVCAQLQICIYRNNLQSHHANKQRTNYVVDKQNRAEKIA